MKTEPGVVVVAVSIGVASALTLLALARAGFAQTLAQNFPCTSPSQGDTRYCTMQEPNPCRAVPQNCFVWGRFFEEQNLPCVGQQGQTVLSGANANANANWSGCATGSVPSSSCEMSEQGCGDVDTYWGANCQENTFCGNVTMLACLGQAYVDCQAQPPN